MMQGSVRVEIKKRHSCFEAWLMWMEPLGKSSNSGAFHELYMGARDTFDEVTQMVAGFTLALAEATVQLTVTDKRPEHGYPLVSLAMVRALPNRKAGKKAEHLARIAAMAPVHMERPVLGEVREDPLGGPTRSVYGAMEPVDQYDSAGRCPHGVAAWNHCRKCFP